MIGELLLHLSIIGIIAFIAFFGERLLKSQKASDSKKEATNNKQTKEEVLDESVEADYESAKEFVSKMSGNISDVMLLNLYGFYKQATFGDNNDPQPSLLSYRQRAKWDAWNNCRGMSSQEAKIKYISFIDKLYPEWRTQTEFGCEGKKKEEDNWRKPVGGFTVGTEEDCQEEGTIWYYVTEENLEKVKEMIDSDITLLNRQDDTGKTPLAWACDRGFEDIVDYLLSQHCKVDVKDNDGFTPLSFAIICEYESICKKLIKHGAQLDQCDEDGSTLSDADHEFVEKLRDFAFQEGQL